jgi:hypothetical protein
MGVPALLQGTSALYTTQLIDPVLYPLGIPASALTSLTLTLYDQATGTVINSRSAQNALNANGVTVDANGNLAWAITPLDTPIVTATLALETHIALFQATWNGGLSGCNHEVSLPVKRVQLVP